MKCLLVYCPQDHRYARLSRELTHIRQAEAYRFVFLK